MPAWSFASVRSANTPKQEPGCSVRSARNGGTVSVLAQLSLQQKKIIFEFLSYVCILSLFMKNISMKSLEGAVGGRTWLTIESSRQRERVNMP